MTAAPPAPGLGEHAAAAPVLAELYERHAPALENFIARWGGFYGEDARDLTHDVFFKAGVALPRMLARQEAGGWFDPEPWLYRIATNVCIDRGRHEALVRLEPWDGPRGWGQRQEAHPRAGRDQDPEAVALDAAGVAEVAAVLARVHAGLNERQGAVLATLAALAAAGRAGGVDDHTNVEVAAALGTTRSVVKTLVWRAREHLRLEARSRDGSRREGT